MKTIYFIRHGKSSWDFAGLDHDRPLNTRGFIDADLIGKALKKENISVQAVYSSSANRAETTARIVSENIEFPLYLIKVKKELYNFEAEEVLKQIYTFSDDHNSVMMFGHNTAFSTLVNSLGSEALFNLPTSGVVSISFKEDKWSKIKVGKTNFSLFPKNLR